MRRAQVHGPDDVRLDEVAEPEPGPRDAVLRVSACGVCGTDVRYARLGGLAGPAREPMPLGHEVAGVLERAGAEFDALAPGTRVVLHPGAGGNRIGNGGPEGGLAPRLLVRNAADGGALFPIPDGIPDEIAALAEPLCVGMQSVDRVDPQPGERVAVFGVGPIGLSAAVSLLDRGVEDVVAIDRSPARLEVARRLGVPAAIDASRDDVWQRLRALHGESPVFGAPMAGTDVYIEASGADPVITEVIRHAKRDARLSVVALHDQEIPVSFLLVMMKQLSIHGSIEYPDDFGRALELMARRDLTPMLGARFPLARLDDALATARDPGAGAKVLVTPLD